MKKVLMVCLGNICRSPLAEAILQSKVNSQEIVVDSAGTADYHTGKQPDIRSIEVAAKFGLDIHKQKARTFEVRDFDTFDHIYVMDKSNYQNVLELARDKNDVLKVKMILNELHPNKNLEVPDPYYGGDQGFKNVYNMLDEACDVIAKQLQ
ncbi:MAG: low molecular weight protein-tyrosine-phosphatase [Polaribacter sp.]|uniref:low molecular weight protein-tyrosine-phosphatase n=1 Tax=Polaribacter sp. TaxID=1920175 RepID=UPI003219FF90